MDLTLGGLMKRFLMLIIVLFAFSANAQPNAKDEITGLIKKAWSKWQTVKNYTCTFYKQNRKNNKLYPLETMFQKFRKKPFSVYLKWVKDPHEGQETLYVQGKNKNRIKAHKGGILGVINVNLDPKGSTAMKGNRHPITEAGMGNTLKIIRQDFALAKKNNEGEITDEGMKTYFGMKLHCFLAKMPAKKVKKGLNKTNKNQYYAAISEVCIDQKIGLPTFVQIWTAQKKLLEKYVYKNMRLNVGLTDKDFDPDNDAYRF